MIKSEQAIEMLFKKFPDFKGSWEEYLEYWKRDSWTIYTFMDTFTDYVTLILKENDKETILKNIFDFAELLMQDGDTDVSEATATCFLENLINIASNGDINTNRFVKLLGKESKKYCKGWDEFCGVKTEGLWDDDLPFSKGGAF
jgi:hypothetical protein